MNQFFTKKMAATSCIIMNTFLLLIHIGLFVFFVYYHIRCMYIFNVFSMVFYACAYFFVWKEMLSQYFQLVAVEVMLPQAENGAGNDLSGVWLWLSVMSARYGSCIFLWKLFFHAGTEEESTWNISGNTEHDIVYCGLCKGAFQRSALCD